MKKLLVFSMVLVSYVSYGQYTKSGIIEVSNMKSEQIYRQSKEWFFNSFKSAKSVIDVDITNEKLMGKGVSHISYISTINNIDVPIVLPMDIIITIDIKDGKYRYNIETPHFWTTDENAVVERTNKMLDSVWKVTPYGWMVSKKLKEEEKKNTIKSIREQNLQVKSTIDILEKSLISSIKEKKDNW